MIAKWKPVSLDGALFSSDFDGLVGIEEFSGYDLNFQQNKRSRTDKISGDTHSKTQKNLKKKKRSKLRSAEVITPSKIGSTSNIEQYPTIEECSMEAWNEYDLCDVIVQGISEQGFKYPTTIQALTLPPAIFGKKDILGAAETGSGKTLAFGLPILNSIIKLKSNIKNSNNQSLYALILTPTRELAIQVKDHLQSVAKYSDISIVAVVGGMAAVKQERLLNRSPEVVVATPGRLWELIQLGYGQLSQIDKIKFLVVDEVDRMLEKGHFLELQNLLEKVNFDEDAKKQRQNFVFSATLELVHDLPKYLVKKMKRKTDNTPEKKLKKLIQILGMTDPKVVGISKGVNLPETLTESRVNCSIIEKDCYVYYFLQKHPGRTIIFCNSIGCVKRLNTLLTLLECNPLPLHASLQQKQRLKSLEKFKDKENSILIATDVAARGLDIPCIDNVIHYQVPRTSESYIHRSGRTARANMQGLTLLLIDPSELQNYIKLCKTLKKSEDISQFPIQQGYFQAIKQTVNLARELDKMQLQVKKSNSEVNWFDKAAKEMDIIVDNKPIKSKEILRSKKLIDIKKKQLMSLLQKPIFVGGGRGKYSLPSEGFAYLENTLQFQENAIDALKQTLNNNKSGKRKFSIYKSKK